MFFLPDPEPILLHWDPLPMLNPILFNIRTCLRYKELQIATYRLLPIWPTEAQYQTASRREPVAEVVAVAVAASRRSAPIRPTGNYSITKCANRHPQHVRYPSK